MNFKLLVSLYRNSVLIKEGEGEVVDYNDVLLNAFAQPLVMTVVAGGGVKRKTGRLLTVRDQR